MRCAWVSVFGWCLYTCCITGANLPCMGQEQAGEEGDGIGWRGQVSLGGSWDGKRVGCIGLGHWNGSSGLATDRWVIWPGSQSGIDGEAPDQWRGCSGATGVLLELINAQLHSWTGLRSSRINGEFWTLWFNSDGVWSMHGVHSKTTHSMDQ